MVPAGGCAGPRPGPIVLCSRLTGRKSLMESFAAEEGQSRLSPEMREFISNPNSRVRTSGTARRATNNPDTTSEASSVFISTSLRDWHQQILLSASELFSESARDRLQVVGGFLSWLHCIILTPVVSIGFTQHIRVGCFPNQMGSSRPNIQESAPYQWGV
jgi:hypothetical protein